jgi:RNA polymerase sigma factor (sigma-70 family)
MLSEPITPVQACLNRWAAGDPLARDDLFRATRDRLLVMTRVLMVRFSRLRRWVESEDVLHNALPRLESALEQIPINTTREFLSIASLNIRRELLDLVRHYFGAHGLGANYGTPPAGPVGRSEELAESRQSDPALLAQWAEMHEIVSGLPDEEREVFALRVYQGLTIDEIAGVLDVSTRTVKRRWLAARVWLARRLGRGIDGEIGEE